MRTKTARNVFSDIVHHELNGASTSRNRSAAACATDNEAPRSLGSQLPPEALSRTRYRPRDILDNLCDFTAEGN
jgi:hypothetical protein